MSDCKRSASTMAAMEASSNGVSSSSSMSKKRKTGVAAFASSSSSSCELQLRSLDVQQQQQHQLPAHSSHYSLLHFHDAVVSPEASVDSAGTVVSFEFCSDRFPLSCCSSSSNVETGEVVKEHNTKPLDLELQTRGFETEDSTYNNFKSFSGRERHYLLNEFSGDSEEESTTFPAKSSPAATNVQRKSPALEMPPKEEIEEFFAMAEKYEQKRFAEKYNFDIVKDMPLEGRYQWLRLH